MFDVLSEIVRLRRLDYESVSLSCSDLLLRYSERVDFRPFRVALLDKLSEEGVVSIIAEIKRGSPSKGIFAPDLDPAFCATEYESCDGYGAAALSVLTERRYFGGVIDDLVVARRGCRLPVLRKDFIVTEYQVFETALYADCMLLIARTLDAKMLKDFYDIATGLKLDVLVEVYDEADIEKIAPFNFPLIGINHRNLATMNVDIENSLNLARHFKKDQTIVAASGINSRNDIEHIMRHGIKSFLIGETLSKSKNKKQLLKHLVKGIQIEGE
jgi:indole-3-glycerol phosphate synthase